MKFLNKYKKHIAVASVILLTLAGLGLYYIFRVPEKGVPPYEPTVELPDRYMVFVEAPSTMYDMMFIASLSSLVVRERYHPMFILDQGSLDDHQLWTIDHMVDEVKDVPKLVFSNDESVLGNLKDRMDGDIRLYPKDKDTLSKFKGFSGVIDVNSLEEALWAGPLARVEDKVIRLGRTTLESQEEGWDRLRSLGINANYVVLTNPSDLSVEHLANSSRYYDNYDSKFHTPALSCLASHIAAYHKGYVITDATPSTDRIYTFENPNFDDTNYILNARAVGYYKTLLNLTEDHYSPVKDGTQPEAFSDSPEYVCIVGSSAAVPQFQIPGNGDGDDLVNSDVIYGFLDGDRTHMDAAVGRLINYNVQGASNQIAKTLGYDYLTDRVTVEYSDGPRRVPWRKHGVSFSGYEITYKRMQVSPGRFICRDYSDEALEYEYYGPALIEQEITTSPETTLEPAVQASGFLAYRGHGSDTGALYMASYVAGDERAVLRGTEAKDLFIPPQTAFFVSCMNGKIHGKDFGEDAPDVEYDKLFSINYLYGGAIALGGATEVSYSNIGQDLDSYPEEFLPGMLNSEWSDGDHEWNRNDAWYAFFWDGILNHEETHGSVGKALQWAENRYLNYQAAKGIELTPFESSMAGEGDGDTGDDKAVHWKEITMFAMYGDPAFTPLSHKKGANDYDPWHNGKDEGME